MHKKKRLIVDSGGFLWILIFLKYTSLISNVYMYEKNLASVSYIQIKYLSFNS